MLMNQSSYKKNGIKIYDEAACDFTSRCRYFCHQFGQCSVFCNRSKQCIKGNLVNLICETKSVLTQDILIMITCSNKTLQLHKTRLHSSRMRTARALTVSPSMLCAWSQGEGAWSREGAWSWGVVHGPWGGGMVSQHVLRQTPPVNRITDPCENITLLQLRCGR